LPSKEKKQERLPAGGRKIDVAVDVAKRRLLRGAASQ